MTQVSPDTSGDRRSRYASLAKIAAATAGGTLAGIPGGPAGMAASALLSMAVASVQEISGLIAASADTASRETELRQLRLQLAQLNSRLVVLESRVHSGGPSFLTVRVPKISADARGMLLSVMDRAVDDPVHAAVLPASEYLDALGIGREDFESLSGVLETHGLVKVHRGVFAGSRTGTVAHLELCPDGFLAGMAIEALDPATRLLDLLIAVKAASKAGAPRPEQLSAALGWPVGVVLWFARALEQRELLAVWGRGMPPLGVAAYLLTARVGAVLDELAAVEEGL